MVLKQDVEKELARFKDWAQEINLKAHLARSEVQSELRTGVMEAQQAIAVLEAKLESWGESADEAVGSALDRLKASYAKLKSSVNDTSK